MSNGMRQAPSNEDHEMKELLKGLSDAILAHPNHVVAAVILKVWREMRDEMEMSRRELMMLRSDRNNDEHIRSIASNVMDISASLSSISACVHDAVNHLKEVYPKK